MKSVDELVDGARRAHAARAKRYCMVTATRGPSQRDLDTICEAATRIKAEMDIELCASLGLLTEAKAQRLAASGVDRFNHNLETSERHYDKIVSTHTLARSRRDRAAREARRHGHVLRRHRRARRERGRSARPRVRAARARRRLGAGELPRRAAGHAARRATPLVEPGLRAARAVHVPVRAPAHRSARRRRPRDHAARAAGDGAVPGELDLHAGLPDDRRRDAARRSPDDPRRRVRARARVGRGGAGRSRGGRSTLRRGGRRCRWSPRKTVTRIGRVALVGHASHDSRSDRDGTRRQGARGGAGGDRRTVAAARAARSCAARPPAASRGSCSSSGSRIPTPTRCA